MYISDIVENLWARGDLELSGGFVRMLVDKDKMQTSFEVLDTQWMRKLRDADCWYNGALWVEVAGSERPVPKEMKQACEALGLSMKIFVDDGALYKTAIVLTSSKSLLEIVQLKNIKDSPRVLRVDLNDDSKIEIRLNKPITQPMAMQLENGFYRGTFSKSNPREGNMKGA